MNFLSEKTASAADNPVISLLYPEIGQSIMSAKEDGACADEPEKAKEANPGPSPEELQAMLTRARLEAKEEVEKRLAAEYEVKLQGHAAQIKKTLEVFESERKKYFSDVETEVVRLSLAIAAKILHREAQVDPAVVAALVRIAIERMNEGSTVTLRVPPAESTSWHKWMETSIREQRVSIQEDAGLAKGVCIVETNLGSADFSLEAQLKEVERGFFDLLALRP